MNDDTEDWLAEQAGWKEPETARQQCEFVNVKGEFARCNLAAVTFVSYVWLCEGHAVWMKAVLEQIPYVF